MRSLEAATSIKTFGVVALRTQPPTHQCVKRIPYRDVHDTSNREIDEQEREEGEEVVDARR